MHKISAWSGTVLLEVGPQYTHKLGLGERVPHRRMLTNWPTAIVERSSTVVQTENSTAVFVLR